MTSKTIFLNGCSSAGKSSIVKVIQHLSSEPWLTMGIDTFIDAMPSKYIGFGEKSEQGICFIHEPKEEGKPVTSIRSGPVFKKVNQSIPKVIKLLVDDGHNIIIDEVILNEEWLKNYVDNLRNYNVYFVEVKCNLNSMEEREFLRGDRVLSLARWQSKVYNLSSNHYDLIIDTVQLSPFANAKKILEFIKSNKPRAWAKI